MVAKPSGGWRACGDYRALNTVSEDDRYPMPHLQDFSIHLEGKTIFSKIDLVRAYNQVPMDAADIAKTAIVTPFGLFEYTRMPFLKNAAQTQRFMDSVFDFPFVYIYLMTFWSRAIHLRDISAMDRLADYGLVVNPKKCVLGQSARFRSTSASGKSTAHHRLSAATVHQATERIPWNVELLQTIRDILLPLDLVNVRQ